MVSTAYGVAGRRSAQLQQQQQRVPRNNDISDADVTTHRSAICLVHQLAQKNNITLEYELLHDPLASSAANPGTTPKPHVFIYKLHLGDESYRAQGSTDFKSKDKVAREAYDKTKYPKPKLKERTCVENASRTIVSILYEYATVNGSDIYDKETQISVRPTKFRIDLTLRGLTAWAEAFSKKDAKEEAARRLVTMIGKDMVLNAITRKFNDPEYRPPNMRPVERLRRILFARTEPPAKYTLSDEISDIGGITYLSRVETVRDDSVGSGPTLADSQDNAAHNLMAALGYEV